MSKFLAFDTSDNNISLAISDDGDILVELSWQTKQNHSVELMPAICHALSMIGISIEQIEAVFVARGPGSYTGLRVGLSVAKGLSWGLKRPVVSASTLELLAYPHSFYSFPVFSLMDAGHGEMAGAIYQRQKDLLVPLMKETLLGIDDIIEKITEKMVICGVLKSDDIHALYSAKGDNIVMPPANMAQRRAAFLVGLCLPRLKRGDVENIATLEPIYLRLPPITKPKRYTYLLRKED